MRGRYAPRFQALPNKSRTVLALPEAASRSTRYSEQSRAQQHHRCRLWCLARRSLNGGSELHKNVAESRILSYTVNSQREGNRIRCSVRILTDQKRVMRRVTINRTVSSAVGSGARTANNCLVRPCCRRKGKAGVADNTHNKLAAASSSSPSCGTNRACKRAGVRTNVRRLERAAGQAGHGSAAADVEINTTDVLDNPVYLGICQQIRNGDGYVARRCGDRSRYVLI